MPYIIRIVPGWIVICALIYIYVIKQWYLVANIGVLIIILFIGVAFSFLCSSVEMAIASLGERELETLSQEGKALRENEATTPQAEYIKMQRRFLKLLLIYHSTDKLNAPIVIFNNVANILIASFLPYALANSQVEPLVLGPSDYQMNAPWGGRETLTFFATIFVLVVFGEVIPKRLGKAYNIFFIKRLVLFIDISDFLFGWIGNSFLSIVEVPPKVGRAIKSRVCQERPQPVKSSEAGTGATRTHAQQSEHGEDGEDPLFDR